VAKSNVTQLKALPSYGVLEDRVWDQRERLYRVQNLLGVTRVQLEKLAEEGDGDLRAIENCGGTLEICQEVVDAILIALDSVNLYATKAQAVQS